MILQILIKRNIAWQIKFNMLSSARKAIFFLYLIRKKVI